MMETYSVGQHGQTNSRPFLLLLLLNLVQMGRLCKYSDTYQIRILHSAAALVANCMPRNTPSSPGQVWR